MGYKHREEQVVDYVGLYILYKGEDKLGHENPNHLDCTYMQELRKKINA